MPDSQNSWRYEISVFCSSICEIFMLSEHEGDGLNMWSTCARLCAQIMDRIRYDWKHKSLHLKEGDSVFLRLNKGYNQLGLSNRKFDKQRIGPVKVVKKIEKLAYKLNISDSWKIHSVVFVTHTESTPQDDDSYDRELAEPESVLTEGDDTFDIYEVKKILVKRVIFFDRGRNRKSRDEFRIKWLGWGDHHNVWMTREELAGSRDLLEEFENRA